MDRAEFEKSRTYANLMAAYAGESQAQTKYLIYADYARKQGNERLAQVYELTAKNERAHAKLWLKYIQNDNDDLERNLRDAASGEHFEWTKMYRDFSAEAHKEGFTDIAARFDLVGDVEYTHEQRYNKFIDEILGKEYEKGETYVWVCTNCGFVYDGSKPVAVCPICGKPSGYFDRISK